MKQTLIAFFKKPTTIIGIVTALMFQLIFSIVWMTAYNGVSDNIDQLKIGIVNEDAMAGQLLVGNVQQHLPFETQVYPSVEAAQEDLINREIYMVMHVPETFTQDISSSEKANISFIVNESNAQMVKNVMQGVSTTITANANKEAVIIGLQQMLGQNQVPAEQAALIAQQLSERVVSQVESLNHVENFSSQMVPMMLVLASYVGAMIMCMNIHQSAMMLGGTISRWHSFFARGIINILASVVIGLVGTSMITLLGAQMEQGFLMMWGFQTIFVLTFLFVAQIFLLLLGNAGMLFNIIMLSVQLVSSGAMIPRDVLPSFYLGLSHYLPATYAVEGVMNILFGGPSVTDSLLSLFWVMLSAIGIGAIVTALPSKKRQEAMKVKEAPAAS